MVFKQISPDMTRYYSEKCYILYGCRRLFVHTIFKKRSCVQLLTQAINNRRNYKQLKTREYI